MGKKKHPTTAVAHDEKSIDALSLPEFLRCCLEPDAEEQLLGKNKPKDSFYEFISYFVRHTKMLLAIFSHQSPPPSDEQYQSVVDKMSVQIVDQCFLSYLQRNMPAQEKYLPKNCELSKSDRAATHSADSACIDAVLVILKNNMLQDRYSLPDVKQSLLDQRVCLWILGQPDNWPGNLQVFGSIVKALRLEGDAQQILMDHVKQTTDELNREYLRLFKINTRRMLGSITSDHKHLPAVALLYGAIFLYAPQDIGSVITWIFYSAPLLLAKQSYEDIKKQFDGRVNYESLLSRYFSLNPKAPRSLSCVEAYLSEMRANTVLNVRSRQAMEFQLDTIFLESNSGLSGVQVSLDRFQKTCVSSDSALPAMAVVFDECISVAKIILSRTHKFTDAAYGLAMNEVVNKIEAVLIRMYVRMNLSEEEKLPIGMTLETLIDAKCAALKTQSQVLIQAGFSAPLNAELTREKIPTAERAEQYVLDLLISLCNRDVLGTEGVWGDFRVELSALLPKSMSDDDLSAFDAIQASYSSLAELNKGFICVLLWISFFFSILIAYYSLRALQNEKSQAFYAETILPETLSKILTPIIFLLVTIAVFLSNRQGLYISPSEAQWGVDLSGEEQKKRVVEYCKALNVGRDLAERPLGWPGRQDDVKSVVDGSPVQASQVKRQADVSVAAGRHNGSRSALTPVERLALKRNRSRVVKPDNNNHGWSLSALTTWWRGEDKNKSQEGFKIVENQSKSAAPHQDKPKKSKPKNRHRKGAGLLSAGSVQGDQSVATSPAADRAIQEERRDPDILSRPVESVSEDVIHSGSESGDDDQSVGDGSTGSLTDGEGDVGHASSQQEAGDSAGSSDTSSTAIKAALEVAQREHEASQAAQLKAQPKELAQLHREKAGLVERVVTVVNDQTDLVQFEGSEIARLQGQIVMTEQALQQASQLSGFWFQAACDRSNEALTYLAEVYKRGAAISVLTGGQGVVPHRETVYFDERGTPVGATVVLEAADGALHASAP